MTEAIISAYKSVSPKVFSNLAAKEDGDDDGRERVDPSLQAAHHHSIDISTSDRDGQVSVSACEKQHHDDFKVSCTSILSIHLSIHNVVCFEPSLFHTIIYYDIRSMLPLLLLMMRISRVVVVVERATPISDLPSSSTIRAAPPPPSVIMVVEYV